MRRIDLAAAALCTFFSCPTVRVNRAFCEHRPFQSSAFPFRSFLVHSRTMCQGPSVDFRSSSTSPASLARSSDTFREAQAPSGFNQHCWLRWKAMDSIPKLPKKKKQRRNLATEPVYPEAGYSMVLIWPAFRWIRPDSIRQVTSHWSGACCGAALRKPLQRRHSFVRLSFAVSARR